MAATSNDAAARALGRRWKPLHRFGIHFLWVFFFASYLLAVQKGNPPGAIASFAFMSLMLLGLGLRAVIWSRKRKRLGARSPQTAAATQ